jgi:hypothetical protein
MADRSTELLYFSLVTLSTIGYGDAVPLDPEVLHSGGAGGNYGCSLHYDRGGAVGQCLQAEGYFGGALITYT